MNTASTGLFLIMSSASAQDCELICVHAFV